MRSVAELINQAHQRAYSGVATDMRDRAYMMRELGDPLGISKFEDKQVGIYRAKFEALYWLEAQTRKHGGYDG